MRSIVAGIATVLVLVGFGLACQDRSVVIAEAKSAQTSQDLDGLLAPVALYPDQLLAHILVCSSDPGKVAELSKWLTDNSSLKGSDLQDAATIAGFEPSFVALVLFPQVVSTMARQLDWTTQLGQAFAANRTAVFDAIQRLRTKAQEAGALKSTPQQDVETKTTSGGEQVIVIEPANPQVVYVPQYDPQVVYVEDNDNDDAVVAGLIGFTAGIAMGAAIDDDNYYGPHGWGWGGGIYMYDDAWDDWSDARDDARDDWTDHREDLYEERGDIAREQQEQRTERTQTRQETRTESQTQRTERQETRTQSSAQRTGAQATAAAEARSAGTASREARGSSQDVASRERTGTKSDAFSGYSSGRSERAASTRGQSSRGSSARQGGGGRRR